MLRFKSHICWASELFLPKLSVQKYVGWMTEPGSFKPQILRLLIQLLLALSVRLANNLQGIFVSGTDFKGFGFRDDALWSMLILWFSININTFLLIILSLFRNWISIKQWTIQNENFRINQIHSNCTPSIVGHYFEYSSIVESFDRGIEIDVHLWSSFHWKFLTIFPYPWRFDQQL